MLMYISTSRNKGIYATAIVQCAAAYKCLQPGSGLVDAFLTGLVTHAPTFPETRLRLANRHVANCRAHRETCVRLRRQPHAIQINVAKREAVQ